MLTIALHGNPGSAEELAPLIEALRASGVADIVTPERPPGGCDWVDLAHRLDRILEERGPDSYRLVGYSWGAYQALRYALETPDPPRAVVLVSPYIVAESPLSGTVAALLEVPGLGRLLLGAGAERRAADFVARAFHPHEPPPDTERTLRRALADARPWVGAVRYKLIQQRSPVPPLDRAPCDELVVVRGAEDAVADWAVQRRPLDRILDHARTRVIEGAGHALPWLYPGELAAAIHETPRIGRKT